MKHTPILNKTINVLHSVGLAKTVSIIMLIGSIVFNLWLYRLEPTATIDPNDNAFQYALVDRTNKMWDFGINNCPKDLFFGICHMSYLVDHWVPNWAQGYNLPYYYSHVPQIAIVASYRSIWWMLGGMSLFTYYHWIIYLLLCIFPLSAYVALKIITKNHLVAGIAALIATHLSTDGLYGLDPSSFLWRGYGLSSQLFAMSFIPIALAYTWRYLSTQMQEGKSYKDEFLLGIYESGIPTLLTKLNVLKLKVVTKPTKTLTATDLESLDQSFITPSETATRYHWKAVIFLVLTTAGHLGMGILALLSIIGMLASYMTLGYLLRTNVRTWLRYSFRLSIRTGLLGGATIFFLSYWIVPILMHNNFHNISVWDPVWKFNSYGADTVIKNLLNGDLLDFGRPLIFTIMTFVGFFICIWKKEFVPIAVLFPFWLIMYFGRTTWGSLIDLIPGMKEYHLSRFIVGIHVAGILLAPIGIWGIVDTIADKTKQMILPFLTSELKSKITQPKATQIFQLFTLGILLYIILPPLYGRATNYNELNEKLIVQANNNHTLEASDEAALFKEFDSLPSGRIFAGRGGGWGKDFRIAETPYYMNLSTYGLATVLWLPETWSPNSDTEQYFIEEAQYTYDMYNIRYVVAPADKKPLDFWKLRTNFGGWKLYDVPTSGYFAAGVRPAVVAGEKTNFSNVVRLWMQSEYPKKQLYPELTFSKKYPVDTGLPNFKMVDEAMYQIPGGAMKSLFAVPPVYMGGPVVPQLSGTETVNEDMMYSTTVTVPEKCVECIILLKVTNHPNWIATVNGRKVKPMIVFPFFSAVPLTNPGTYTITFTYTPSALKIGLLLISLLTALTLTGAQTYTHFKSKAV